MPKPICELTNPDPKHPDCVKCQEVIRKALDTHELREIEYGQEDYKEEK